MAEQRGRDIAGRKAVVTGAASGMGAAAVERLIADGCAVLAVDRVDNGLAGTHDLVADLGDADSFARIAAVAEAHLGGCDIVINNAGVCPTGPFDDMTDAMWDSALSINVTAAMKLTRALLPMLRQSNAGRVINIGSIMSRYGDEVPWHRVVRADGTCAAEVGQRQLPLLRSEGVPFGKSYDRVRMSEARWEPREHVSSVPVT